MKITGTFIKNELQGKGKNAFLTFQVVEVHTNGFRYEGGYVDGMKHGEGFITYSNGDRLRGIFEKNFLEGEGKLRILSLKASISSEMDAYSKGSSREIEKTDQEF